MNFVQVVVLVMKRDNQENGGHGAGRTIISINYTAYLFMSGVNTELPHWIAQLKAGNNQPLEKLFERYGSYCVRTLQRRTGCSRQDAEDVLQESVIVFRSNALSGRITHASNLRSYLYTICLNLYRTQAERQVARVNRQQEAARRWHDDGVTSSDAEAYQQQVQTVLKALDQLRPSCQRLLRYFYLQGYTMAEIAEQMHLANTDVAKNMKYQCLQGWIEKIQELTNPTVATKNHPR